MRNRRWISMAVALLILAVAGGTAIWFANRKEERSDPDDAAQVALGKIVYQDRCASCHGASLQGQSNWQDPKPDGRLPAPPHDETGHTWHHPQNMLFAITKQGIGPFAPEGYQSDMPAFGDTLTDDEIRAVLAFIASTWPADIRARWMAISQPIQR